METWLGISSLVRSSCFSYFFTNDFLILMEREKGDSSILQLRPDCLMVLRIVSQTVAVGSMVGFYFFQSELNLLVNISNSFNASVLFVCLLTPTSDK